MKPGEVFNSFEIPLACKCDSKAGTVIKPPQRDKHKWFLDHVHFKGPGLDSNDNLQTIIQSCTNLIRAAEFDKLEKALSEVCMGTRDYVVTESIKQLVEMKKFRPRSDFDKSSFALYKFFANNYSVVGNEANEDFMKGVFGDKWNSSSPVVQEYALFYLHMINAHIHRKDNVNRLPSMDREFNLVEKFLSKNPFSYLDDFIFCRRNGDNLKDKFPELPKMDEMQVLIDESLKRYDNLSEVFDNLTKEDNKSYLGELLKDKEQFVKVLETISSLASYKREPLDLGDGFFINQQFFESLDHLYQNGLLGCLNMQDQTDRSLLFSLLTQYLAQGIDDALPLTVLDRADMMRTSFADFVAKSNIPSTASSQDVEKFKEVFLKQENGLFKSNVFVDILLLRMGLIKDLNYQEYGKQLKDKKYVSALLYGASAGFFKHDSEFSQRLLPIVNKLLANEDLKKQLSDGDWYNLACFLRTDPGLNNKEDHKGLLGLMRDNKPKILLSAFVLSDDDKCKDKGKKLADKLQISGSVEDCKTYLENIVYVTSSSN